jgi:hypothetical protein
VSLEIPLNPDLSGIELSASGTDFSDCAIPQPQAPLVDLTQFAALAPGEMPAQERQRKPAAAAAPNIDHLSLKE